jgi:2'-5' RNA ligase
MDDNEDDYDESVMIALLPVTSDWCRIELPHMTLVFAGELKDLEDTDFNKMAKDAASLAMMTRPLTLMVKEVEVYGDKDKVDVICLRPTPELEAMRHVVEGWNASEYPFKPHVTIGPVGTRMLIPAVPEYITFDRIMVAWGEETLTFWLHINGMPTIASY